MPKPCTHVRVSCMETEYCSSYINISRILPKNKAYPVSSCSVLGSVIWPTYLSLIGLLVWRVISPNTKHRVWKAETIQSDISFAGSYPFISASFDALHCWGILATECHFHPKCHYHEFCSMAKQLPATQLIEFPVSHHGLYARWLHPKWTPYVSQI